MYSSLAVSGATTLAATDDYAMAAEEAGTSRQRQYMKAHFFFALTPGSNTFTMHHRVASGTGSFSNRRIFILPF
jgi:hypothetical protein